MKIILRALLFCLFSANVFATNVAIEIHSITSTCNQDWYRADIVGGIGPFSFVFKDNLGGTTGILAYGYDSVLVESNRNVPIDYYVVTVTDLSDNTTATQTFTLGDEYRLNPNPDTLIVTSNSSCGIGCNGAISLCNYSARNPYQAFGLDVNWMNDQGNIISQNSDYVINQCSGRYSVLINIGHFLCTHYVACIATIPSSPPTNLPVLSIDSVVSGNCFATAYSSITGGVAPYTYYWDGIAGGNTDSTLITGTHYLKIKDSRGCSDSVSFNATSLSNISLSEVVFPQCDNLSDSIIINVTGGILPYSYMWNTNPVQFTQTASGLTPGIYEITVADNVGCSLSKTVVVPSRSVVNLVADSLFSCASANFKVVPNGGQSPYQYLWSNNSASNTVIVNVPGNYSVTVTDAYGCTALHDFNFHFGTTNTVRGQLFIDADGDCIYDSGEQTISNALIEAQPGNHITTTGAFGAYTLTVDSGNYSVNVLSTPLYFNLNCQPSHSLNFSSYCNDSSAISFSGAYLTGKSDVEVTLTSSRVRPGLGMAYYINYKNLGTIFQFGTISLFYDPLLTLNTSIPLYNSFSSSQIDFNYSSLAPGASGMITVYMNVATPANGGVVGDSVYSSASASTWLTDINPSNNSSGIYSVMTGSFDPNEKTVSPQSLISNPDSLLTYTVYFQNTGNDTAFKVVIIDTLSALFDLSTFSIKGYSHPMSWKISDNILTCNFNNILLPDSTINELKSHGFVKYAVKLKQGLLSGTDVTNKADIYFDFNTPVATNTTLSTYDATVGINETVRDFKVNVYPVPSDDKVYINWKDQSDKISFIEIYDISNRLIYRERCKAESFVVTKNEIKEAGAYFFRLNNASGYSLAAGKFILTK